MSQLKEARTQYRRNREKKMQEILKPHEDVFHGIELSKVNLVHIDVYKSVKPYSKREDR